jgi:hypothetical protein
MSNVKVKLLVGRIDGNTSNAFGDIIDVPAAEAKALLESGQAEPVAAAKAKRSTKAVAAANAESR